MSVVNPLPDWEEVNADYWIGHAIREVQSTYGDKVSVARKRKSLHKFGRTENADDDVKTTVSNFQGAVVNETFATGNTVDSVVSSSASDTETLLIEGHYFSGSDFIFVVQEVTLTGQTPVTLGTSLCRASRIKVKNGTLASPASHLVGTVSVYDSTEATGVTAGVPDVATATKAMAIGNASEDDAKNQTEKCASSLSSTDYFFVREIFASIDKDTGGTPSVQIEVEYREIGGVWLPIGLEFNLAKGSTDQIHDEMEPYIIIPKNSDFRMVATSDAANTIVSGYVHGVLARIVN